MAYQTLSIYPLAGGLKLQIPPHRLPDQFSPRVSSTRMRDGVIMKRPGLLDFNGTTALGTSASVIVSLIQYHLENGTVETVAVLGGPADGDRDIYRTAGGAWASIKDAGLTLKGSTLEPYDAAVAPTPANLSVLYLSNGVTTSTVTEMIRWTGSGTATAFNSAPGSARTLATYANRLILGNIYDGTAIRGLDVAWSADGDADTWAGVGTGEVSLIETPDFITKMLPLRGRLIIYKTDSIFIGQETGYSVVPIAFGLVTKDYGAIAGFSVAAGGGLHFFLGRDNVYAFDGTQPFAIGDDIRRDLRLINQNALRQVFAMVDQNTSEYWLFVPEGQKSYPTAAWIYNWQERHWNRWELPTLTCGTSTPITSIETWATIMTKGTKWPELSGKTWDEMSSISGPTAIVGRFDRTTDELTSTTLNDNGVAIPASWESRDVDFIGQPGSLGSITTRDLKTLARISVRYRGVGGTSSLTCDVSTDGGQTFSATSPAPGTASISGGIIHFNTWITADRFRIRLRNATTSEQIPAAEEIVLSYLPGPSRL